MRDINNYMSKKKDWVSLGEAYGDVLNKERMKELFNAGLSTLLISVYDGDHAAKKFQEMCDENNLNNALNHLDLICLIG